MKQLFKRWAIFCFAALITLAAGHDSVQAEQRFIDHGNGTVTDRKLGLMWAKNDNQADIFWNQIQGWLENDFPDSIPQMYGNWSSRQNHTPNKAQLYPHLDFG